MDFKRLPLACTIFDLAALSHSSIFTAETLPVAWRHVVGFMKEATVPSGEFVLFVHGYFDLKSARTAFQPFLEPMCFSCADRTVMSVEAVEFAVNSVEEAYAATKR